MLHFLPKSYGPIFLDPAETYRRARRKADTARHQADRLALEADRLEATLKEGS
jgi:hypothetical protein